MFDLTYFKLLAQISLANQIIDMIMFMNQTQNKGSSALRSHTLHDPTNTL